MWDPLLESSLVHRSTHPTAPFCTVNASTSLHCFHPVVFLEIVPLLPFFFFPSVLQVIDHTVPSMSLQESVFSVYVPNPPLFLFARSGHSPFFIFPARISPATPGPERLLDPRYRRFHITFASGSLTARECRSFGPADSSPVSDIVLSSPLPSSRGTRTLSRIRFLVLKFRNVRPFSFGFPGTAFRPTLVPIVVAD